MQQLTFQFKEPKPITVRKSFAQLSIDEKINYKANSEGFGIVPYLSRFNYYKKPLDRIETRFLTNRYFIHYRANSGEFNRIESYMKSKNKTLKFL